MTLGYRIFWNIFHKAIQAIQKFCDHWHMDTDQVGTRIHLFMKMFVSILSPGIKMFTQTGTALADIPSLMDSQSMLAR